MLNGELIERLIELREGKRHGLTRWLARATGLSEGQASRIINGRAAAPVWLMCVVELLELVDRQYWPARWR